jgi:nucleolysin TIA-1/TIAR
MAENLPAATLPPPPSTVGAPGYDGASGSNGHAPPSMGPPALPPVVIPPNNNNVPTPVTPGSALSPSSGGVVRRAAPEPNKRALYVGGLDPRVTEDVLKQIFETTGHVVSVKIIPDKAVCSPKLCFPLPD